MKQLLVIGAATTLATMSVFATDLPWAGGDATLGGGKVLFGDNGDMYPTTETSSEVQSLDPVVNLRSGTAIGKTANSLELGALQLTGDGLHTLELGPTATMAFTDSSGKPWAGKLIIKGFRDGAVKFGDSVAALTAAQQNMIRAESEHGMKLYLLPNGYLAPYDSRIVIH